jgi:hypothetical protein
MCALQVAVLRLFVIRALEADRPEAVKRFYERHGSTLMTGPDSAEWATWFALPYLRMPSADTRFQVWHCKTNLAIVKRRFSKKEMENLKAFSKREMENLKSEWI